ncbi:hypothetical protein RE6C_02095 [Rhodopirellula europaea 6C]|uniref:Uncharacterized protein n=1 Tax=Rhodopirellula europaea 6C TaxID=1263867 RepID=M2AWW8_9BACT|nr:hypothetical protein RE6C_02095 [Rhodopirellula europaea 6C]
MIPRRFAENPLGILAFFSLATKAFPLIEIVGWQTDCCLPPVGGESGAR